MDYLFGSIFEVQKDQYYNKNYVMTIDADGKAWYLNSDWLVPAVTTIDLTILGDEI